jgi:hypothetical protein
MASTPEGRALTEAHRQAQIALRAAFLQQFMQLWPLLDADRLDETSPGWVTAVMGIIRPYRQRSAELAVTYHLDYRQAEVPDLGPGPSRPTSRPAQPRSTSPAPAPTRRAPARPVTRLTPRQRSTGRVELPEFTTGPRERTRIEIPEIDWEPLDQSAEIGLQVTGPVSQKSKTKRGMTPAQAKDVSLVEAAGSATRSVLTGGRRTSLQLVENDKKAIGWIRVTDGDPCAFCAMLASRGPFYKDRRSFDESDARFEGPGHFKAHDNCACILEPVYYKTARWPGRASEFNKLWGDIIGFAPNNRYSGAEARRVFRREYERRRRGGRETEVA